MTLSRPRQFADGVVSLDRRPLRVLVVGTADWAIEQAASHLAEVGHIPERCHDLDSPAFPCNLLREGRSCPLDAGVDVVLTMRSDPSTKPPIEEFGVVCALHANVPLVVAGLSTPNPYQPWAQSVVPFNGDVVTACEQEAAKEVHPC